MKRVVNEKLSEFFSRHEVLYASAWFRDRHDVVHRLADVNHKHIDEYNEDAFIDLCQRMDVVRVHVNLAFKSDIDPDKHIGLKVTSGWRCHAWELLKGRSGTSQHVIAALDVQPTNCSPELAIKIIAWMHKFYSSTVEGQGWPGGFAIARPKYNPKTNQLISIGFAHYDLGRLRRWKY